MAVDTRPATVVSRFRVNELDCATEESELRDVLGVLAGVRSLEFDLVARRVAVTHTLASVAPIEAAIRSAGMRPHLLVVTPTATQASRTSLSRSRIIVTVVAGLFAIGSEVAVIAGLGEQSIPVGLLAVIGIGLGGRETLRKGFMALRAPQVDDEPVDVGCGDRRRRDRPMARSRRGDLAVRCRGTD